MCLWTLIYVGKKGKRINDDIKEVNMVDTPITDARIKTLDNIICTNIDNFSSTDRGFLSQNILSQLRKIVEHVF